MKFWERRIKENQAETDPTFKAPWAASPNFALKFYKGTELKEDGSEVPAEIDEEDGFIEYGKTKAKPRHGFRINEVKYQLLRSKHTWIVESVPARPNLSQKITESEDGNTIYLKCKGGGAAVTLTERAIILGTWAEGTPTTGPGCHQIIEELGKHLREHKY